MSDTQWYRALDRMGRLFTIARTKGSSYLYFPNLDASEITFASGGVINDPNRKPVSVSRPMC